MRAKLNAMRNSRRVLTAAYDSVLLQNTKSPVSYFVALSGNSVVNCSNRISSFEWFFLQQETSARNFKHNALVMQ